MNRIVVLAALCAFLPSAPTSAGTWMDNFDDGDLAEWKMVTCLWMQDLVIPDSGNWIVEDGAAVGGDNDVSTRYDLYTGDMSWTDYTAEVRVKLSKDLQDCSSNSSVALGVRLQQDEGKLGLCDYALGLYNASGVEFAEVFTYDNGQFSNVRNMAFPTQADTWYRLKIGVSGNQVRAFVDNTEIGAFQSARFSSGMAVMSANGVRAMFDDFLVTGPDIPNGGPGFSSEPAGRLATTWAKLKQMSHAEY